MSCMVPTQPEPWLNEATQEFVRQHADDDVRQLALQGTKSKEVNLQRALDQIRGRQTAQRKLPTWAANSEIWYPPHLSMEQCSSEQTARYKARLVCRLLSSSLLPLGGAGEGAFHLPFFIDLTGGFGVDFAFIASELNTSSSLPLGESKGGVYVEQQPHLCELARHNFQALGLAGVEVVNGDGTDCLRQLSHTHVIFLDPARRDTHGARTYAISDCTPDVLALRDELLQKADHVVVKLSPMLDWHQAVEQLQAVTEVHILSVGNECKELLLVMKGALPPASSPRGSNRPPLRVFCVNDETVFSYEQSSTLSSTCISAATPIASPSPHHWLYEPNASIMKAGCFSELAAAYPVCQLSVNTHLFLSTDQIEDFPGRHFQIQAVSSLNKRDVRTLLQGIDRANVAVRNFPMSADELRRRLKLKDGGDTYLFGVTLNDGTRSLLHCRKV